MLARIAGLGLAFVLSAVGILAEPCVPQGAPRAMSADLVDGSHLFLTFFWQADCRAEARWLGEPDEYISAPEPYVIGSMDWPNMVDTEWHEPWPASVSNNYWFLQQDGSILHGCPAVACEYFGNIRTDGWNDLVTPASDLRGFAQWDDGDGPWFEVWVRHPDFGYIIAHADRSDSLRVGPHSAHTSWVRALETAGVDLESVVSVGKLDGHEGANFVLLTTGDVWRVDGALTPSIVGNTFQWWPQNTGVQLERDTWGRVKALYR